ncbi:hypothetical protein ACN47E_003121 [Coniothyrium glycines]
MNTHTKNQHQLDGLRPAGASSFPEPAVYFPSSPPPYDHTPKTASMDQNSGIKSELPKTNRPVLQRMKSEETERPTSGQQVREDTDETAESEEEDREDDGENEEEEEEDTDPADPIAEIDWDDLHQRYVDSVRNCEGQEIELMKEWTSLTEYFRIWAESGHDHETDRASSRLRTRMVYVQHSEEILEQKRAHYVNVVKAFESALNLLKANNMGR